MANEVKEDKIISVLNIAKKLNKEFDSTTFLRQSNIIPAYHRLRSKALGMDYPLFGGLPYGRICVYSGKPHSGKTTAACAELAAYQKENPNKYCLYVDVEQALDLQFEVLMNDIDQTHLLVMTPDEGMSGEQILGAVLEMQLQSDDLGLIVIDSIPALQTAQTLKNEFEKDMGKQGTIAKSLHKFCGEIIPSLRKKDNILILINQVRVKDTMYNGAPIYSEPGGDSPKFYSSVSVRFGTRVFMKGDTEISGENNGDGADGFRLKFQVTKNKTAPCNRGGGFITYNYTTGMDWLKDMLDIATTFEFIKRINTSQYQLVDLDTGEVLLDETGKILKGYKKDLINYILTHEDFKQYYLNMLFDHISSENTQKANLLSEESLAEIKEEESRIQKED